MKQTVLLTALVVLSGCMEPVTTVQGAIPFAQLLEQTQGRPYECVNYEATTDSCSTLSRFRVVTSRSYVMTSAVRLAPDVPVIEMSVTMREQGTVQCTDFSDAAISMRGDTSFTAELALAQIEAEARQWDRFCGSYIPNGDGYIFRVTAGSDNNLAEPNQQIQFFAAPKRLRVRE